ncbi:MAG TPA: hypothetical protein VJT31_40925, partial [Rugosimonospora sp.]|nr:hypothetical protein [Rugosimonospora sp.]
TTPVTGDTPVPVAQSRPYPAFPGVPWYVYLGGLGLAAAVAYGLRRYVGLMSAAAGCDLGAAGGVPHLRER